MTAACSLQLAIVQWGHYYWEASDVLMQMLAHVGKLQALVAPAQAQRFPSISAELRTSRHRTQLVAVFIPPPPPPPPSCTVHTISCEAVHAGSFLFRVPMCLVFHHLMWLLDKRVKALSAQCSRKPSMVEARLWEVVIDKQVELQVEPI